eukprot:8923243-Karenia_brevis.AAC.1
MSAMRSALAAYQDVATTSDPSRWVNFLEAVANAHYTDLGTQKQEIMQIVEGQVNQSKHPKGINIKDLKPDKYEGKKSAQSFKQWAEDTVAW